MVHQKQPGTHAGFRLRALREAYTKKQLEVELEANLGIGYLQRLELGKVQFPERHTLERILAGIGANYRECAEILGLFGYAIRFSTPDLLELKSAVNVFMSEIEQNAFPAYLLDCSHRVLAWNSLMPRLFGDIHRRTGKEDSAPRMFFDPACGITARIQNPDTFFLEQIRILEYECQRWQAEAWHSGFVEHMRQFDIFDEYWGRQQASSSRKPSTRPASVLQLDIGCGLARFRLIAETLAHDPRFRIIHYVPADAVTIHQCLKWQSE